MRSRLVEGAGGMCLSVQVCTLPQTQQASNQIALMKVDALRFDPIVFRSGPFGLGQRRLLLYNHVLVGGRGEKDDWQSPDLSMD
jgi:hypothetical protein